MPYPKTGPFVTASAPGEDAPFLNNLETWLATALQADGDVALTASQPMTRTKPLVDVADANAQIGFGLTGSNDTGIYDDTHNVGIGSGTNAYMKLNNYYDGANDRFTNSSGAAIQVVTNTTNGLQWRKSTNTATANGIITWGSYQAFGSQISYFSGSGAGTFSHGLGTTPSWVGITENVSNATMTVGVDSIGSTTVHVNTGTSSAWIGIAIK